MCRAMSVRQGKHMTMVAHRMKSKLENVLFQNNGHSKLCEVSEILSKNETTLEGGEPVLNGNDLTFFKYGSVASCDVERILSSYKMILGDNRRTFTFESLKEHVFMESNPINDGN
jgi:hypothetical protein